jgi:lipid-binding SYLF domain-containing protein
MKKQKRMKMGIGMVLAIFTIGLVFMSYTSAIAADETWVAQGLVDRARITFNDFMHDPNFVWLHENINQAKAILIFPEVIKGGFIVGGSGGTGVLLVRDEKTGSWSDPAFYTLGAGGFGPQIGAEESEVIMVATSQKAIDALLSSSFEMGGDVSFAFGPVGQGAKATVTVPEVNADFVSFAKSKGLYAGINLGGSDIYVRNNLNTAYYHKAVTPADIIVKKDVSNRGATELQEALKNAA